MLLLAAVLDAGAALNATEPGDTSGASFGSDQAHGAPAETTPALWKHVELKREFTDRGTAEESSRTTLRLEVTPKSFVSLIRVDLPFVDEKNGNPTTPHLGDLKLRFESRSMPLGGARLIPSLEVTFPTADPTSLGSGKYQVGPGVELPVTIWRADKAVTSGPWAISVEPMVRQVFSVAGDETFTEINYTKFEPALKLDWRQKLTLKLTPKMVFDWEQGGESGAVLELEPGWNISRRWRTELTLGEGLWGRGLPTTYGRKVELTVRFNF